MKILLDECLPTDFRHSFRAQEAHSAQWAGLKGKKNGELLNAAELAGYAVLLTVDQGLAYQQNLTERKLCVISIRSRTNQLEDLLALVPAIENALKTINLGEVVRIEISQRHSGSWLLLPPARLYKIPIHSTDHLQRNTLWTHSLAFADICALAERFRVHLPHHS